MRLRIVAIVTVAMMGLSGLITSSSHLLSMFEITNVPIAQTESIDATLHQPISLSQSTTAEIAREYVEKNRLIYDYMRGGFTVSTAEIYSYQLVKKLLNRNSYVTQNSIALESAELENNDDQPFFRPGEHLRLLPKNSQPNVELGGTIQFLAQLVNPHSNQAWRVQIEAIVTNEDGSSRTAINPRAIWLFPGQSIEMPIKFKAKESKYQPGLTLFTAFIRDMSGKIIDEATIAFQLETEE